MSKPADARLSLLLVTDSRPRLEALRRLFAEVGIDCALRVVERSSRASAYLRRLPPYRKAPPPDLVMIDFAELNPASLSLVGDIAFGDKRTDVPVVLLTGPESEPPLENGEIDDGKAIMFPPRSMMPFLQKLAGPDVRAIVRAVGILGQFGPTLVRLSDTLLAVAEEQQSLSHELPGPGGRAYHGRPRMSA